MKNFTKLTALSLVASLALVGCGSTSSATSEADTTLQGYFIDAAVAGATYVTSSGITGTTDANGSFKYNEGDSVKFTLGKMVLGEATPLTDGLVTPKTLIAGDTTPTTDEDSKITLLLQTLQSLDSDNDPSNGITIKETVVEDLQNLSKTTDFKSLDEDTLIELDNTYDLGLDEDYDGKLDVNTTDAEAHFNGSLKDWDNGKRPNVVTSQDTQIQNGADFGVKSQYAQNDDNTSDDNVSEDSNTTDTQLIDDNTTQTLTPGLVDALAHMGNEERLAYDVYTNIYNYQLNEKGVEISQLINIATKSEATHVGKVQELVQKYNITAEDISDVESGVADSSVTLDAMPSGVYDIEAIQNLYDSLYALGQTDTESALKVGCMVEVVDINDLSEYIDLAQESNATDVATVFENLRDGSYNHYWAFDKALKNIGVENGCYYEGDALLGENKEGIYPTNDSGNNSSDDEEESSSEKGHNGNK